MSLVDSILGFARLFLRTPLERATIDAVPAGERLIDAIEAHFKMPQGAKDKALFEAWATEAQKAMGQSTPSPAPPEAVPSPIAPPGVDYGLGHGGGSIMRGE